MKIKINNLISIIKESIDNALQKPFSNSNAKITYGNIEDLIAILRNRSYEYKIDNGSNDTSSYDVIDIPGNFNHNAWTESRCKPEMTYSLEIEYTKGKITSVIAIYYNHYNGTYSYSTGGELINTNMIPVRAD